MKRVVMALLAVISFNGYANDIKLECNLEARLSDGRNTSKEFHNAMVIVQEDEIWRSIDVYDSDSLIFLGAYKDPNKQSKRYSNVKDRSNGNSWDIRGTLKDDRSSISYDITVVIDRNTGNLFGSVAGSNGFTTTYSGPCSKVDVTKRKF